MDGFDGFDELDEVATDPNFDRRAQSAFDNLNDATDWTWSGIAAAFARRYGLADLMELQAAIQAEIDVNYDFNIEVLR